MKKYNVLIFPAGAENALEIYNSLKYNLHLNVFGLSSKSDHAEYIYPKDRYIHGEYNISSESFLDNLNKLISDLKIDIVIPTHDTVSLYFAKNKKLIHSKVLTSEYRTAKIAREKKLTYELFANEEFCPIIYNCRGEVTNYPVLLKSNVGEGARNIVKINNERELDFYYSENMIISEFLPGEEMTVDCFTNRLGELLFIGPRTRERIQMGISFRSKNINLTKEIEKIASKINKKLNFRGAWFFQVKKDSNGIFKLLEVSVRQAGTMALYRQLGVNFALLGIFDLLEMDVKILKNDFDISLDRCLYNRYKFNFEYESVYIDLDDTLIVNDKVNTTLMQYIYQSFNKGIKVYLITKHEKSVEETLERYRISSTLFDEILHISSEDQKSNYISKNSSILIDNYFSERLEAKLKLGIPVFDVDMVEALLD